MHLTSYFLWLTKISYPLDSQADLLTYEMQSHQPMQEVPLPSDLTVVHHARLPISF